MGMCQRVWTSGRFSGSTRPKTKNTHRTKGFSGHFLSSPEGDMFVSGCLGGHPFQPRDFVCGIGRKYRSLEGNTTNVKGSLVPFWWGLPQHVVHALAKLDERTDLPFADVLWYSKKPQRFYHGMCFAAFCQGMLGL